MSITIMRVMVDEAVIDMSDDADSRHSRETNKQTLCSEKQTNKNYVVELFIQETRKPHCWQSEELLA